MPLVSALTCPPCIYLLCHHFYLYLSFLLLLYLYLSINAQRVNNRLILGARGLRIPTTTNNHLQQPTGVNVPTAAGTIPTNHPDDYPLAYDQQQYMHRATATATTPYYANTMRPSPAAQQQSAPYPMMNPSRLYDD